jgi:hypothetical protein
MDGHHDLRRLVIRLMVPALGALALWGAAPALATEMPKWFEGEGGISVAKEVKWTNGKLRFDDNNFGSQTEVECGDTGSGTAGASGIGEITKWTISGCTAFRGCPAPMVLTAEHLPWKTELAYVTGGIADRFIGKTGTPEIRLECSGGGGRDECAVTKFPTLTNLEKGGVSAKFNLSESFTCSIEHANLEGARTLELTNGHKLSVH